MSNKQKHIDAEKQIRKEHGDAMVNKAIEDLDKHYNEPLVNVWSEEEGSAGETLTLKKDIADIYKKKRKVSYPKKYFCMYKRK